MTTTTHERPMSAASVAYLAAVGAALVGVPDSDRQELLDDLAEHLAELAHENDAGLIERLGPPEQYAAELLASAGIEPATSARPGRLHVVERARAARALFDQPLGLKLRAIWHDLLPGWWVVRAWLVLAALAARSGLQEALWLPNVTGNRFAGEPGHTLVDLALLVGAIVVSVRVGRGPRWPAWIATALGLLALVSVLSADRSYFYRVDDQTSFPTPGVMLEPNGNNVTNIFAFDASGKPIAGIYLTDQNGAPLDVGNGSALQENGVPFVAGTFPQPELIPNDAGDLRMVQPKPPRVVLPRLPQLYRPTPPKATKKKTTVKPAGATAGPAVTVP